MRVTRHRPQSQSLVTAIIVVPDKSNAIPPDDNGNAPPARPETPVEAVTDASVASCTPPTPTTDDEGGGDSDVLIGGGACGGGEGGGATELARLRTSSVGTTEGNPCTARSRTPKESTLNTPPSLLRDRSVAGGHKRVGRIRVGE